MSINHRYTTTIFNIVTANKANVRLPVCNGFAEGAWMTTGTG